MNNNRAGKRVTLYALIAAFGGFVFGLDAANISGVVRFVSAQFELTSLQVGTVVGCAIVGVILALFFTGSLCDRLGRKKVLVAIGLTYTLSSLLSAFAVNYYMLVVGRFIGGVAFASITVSAMYIGEIAPAEKRGQFVSVNQLLITLGSLLAFIVNYLLVKYMAQTDWLHEQNVWRFMLGFELLPNFIWVMGLLFIPESPRWLIAQGREQEAEQVLARVSAPAKISSLIASVRDSIVQGQANPPSKQLRILLGKPMRFVLALVVIYAVVQGGSGMNAVLFYAPMVFEQVGMSVEDTFMQTILLGAVSVLFTLVAIGFVEKLGRRFLTLTGLALIVVAHTSIWYGFQGAEYHVNQATVEAVAAQEVNAAPLQSLVGNNYTSDVALKRDLADVYDLNELSLVTGPVINAAIKLEPGFVLFGLFLFLAAFNMSIGPIMWVFFSEVFSTRVRSVALPFAALVQSISSWSIQQFFPWQLENLGSALTFLTYGAVALVGWLLMYKWLPETKNKSIEAIERDLVPAA